MCACRHRRVCACVHTYVEVAIESQVACYSNVSISPKKTKSLLIRSPHLENNVFCFVQHKLSFF